MFTEQQSQSVWCDQGCHAGAAVARKYVESQQQLGTTRSLALNWELTNTAQLPPHNTTRHWHWTLTPRTILMTLISLSLSLSYYRTGLTGGLRRLRILIYYRLPGTWEMFYFKLWWIRSDQRYRELTNVILIFQPTFPSLCIPFLSVSKWLYNYHSHSQRSHLLLSEWIFSNSQSSNKANNREKSHPKNHGKISYQSNWFVVRQHSPDKPWQGKYWPVVDWWIQGLLWRHMYPSVSQCIPVYLSMTVV